jgi:ATP-dependent RNA circularization protein (DNA/RNA ligase family)
MKKLTTKRLLAYKNALLTFSESEEGWIVHGVLGKDSPYWQETYKNAKEILATREHIL